MMIDKRKKLLQQDPYLIKRYIRLRMQSKSRGLARFVMRRVLPLKERERERAIENTLTEFAKQTAKSRNLGFESSSTLFNIGLFFLIADRDIQSVKIDALTHPDPWKRSLCARMILLTIHELDLDKVAGLKLRAALENSGVSEEAKRQSAQALRAVRTAQQKAQKQFVSLRNSTIAHRDPDALMQYRSITQINELEVLRIANEFYDGTHLFLDVLPRLILEVGTLPGLLNQLRSRSGVKPKKQNV
ncbi:hypothetical protein JWZ98_01825 [Methylomonas sp. EFPC1]|uniref:Con-6 family protein n=1 Tax=Methylomonas sp. EFPC1 TaxID=2812647 RepID=UPI0019686340|nr:Con-6 family protein [Methylomonas sp. EFPC1]QSB01728.1 hypothetical protein JWZ98_01825 [Methylomonas sp. EFPC1]